jgi:hypothetical protein
LRRPRATSRHAETVDNHEELDHEELSHNGVSEHEKTFWSRVHSQFCMVDLNLVHSDDEDDGDYAEGSGDAKVPEPRYEQHIDIQRIGLLFEIPGDDKGKSISDFPVSFVRRVVERFNRDYLVRPGWRREYKKLVAKRDLVQYSASVRHLLTSKKKSVKMDRKSACTNA